METEDLNLLFASSLTVDCGFLCSRIAIVFAAELFKPLRERIAVAPSD